MKELTQERSEILASQIEAIKTILFIIDFDYLKLSSDHLIQKGIRMDSAAVLLTGYSPNKAELFREQGKALALLKDFHDSLHRCEELKQDIKGEQRNRDYINKLFA